MDLQTPHTALPVFPMTLSVFWRISTHLITFVHTQLVPRSREANTIATDWAFTERRLHHLERTVHGRYLLSYHTVDLLCSYLITSEAQYCLRIAVEPCIPQGFEHWGTHAWYANSTDQIRLNVTSRICAYAWHATLCHARSGFQTRELRRNCRAKYGIVTRGPIHSNTN